MRTLLFVVVALLIMAVSYLSGSTNPLQDAIVWWPYQVITANIITIAILSYFTGKEGMRFRDLFGYDRQRLKRDLLLVIPILLAGGIVGGIGMFGTSFLIFGTPPPATMFQPLPPLALWVAVVALPITNALAETTTYMGYALPRLEETTRNKYLPLVLAATFLALQHIAFPLIPEADVVLWRFVSTWPLAFLVGGLYLRMRRLVPLTIVHFIMDLQLMLTYFQV